MVALIKKHFRSKFVYFGRGCNSVTKPALMNCKRVVHCQITFKSSPVAELLLSENLRLFNLTDPLLA